MRKENITKIISDKLVPLHLEVVNESDSHQGPPGRETHFKLIVVSDFFSDQSRIERHQTIYSLLDNELKTGLHALALKLFTKSEWDKKHGQINLNSPDCSHK